MEKNDSFVKANYKDKTDLEIANILGISERKVRGIRERLKIKKAKTPHKYTDEQLLFLKTNRPKKNINELAVSFNKKFNTNIKPRNITSTCRNHGYYCQLSLSELNTTTKFGDEVGVSRSRIQLKTEKGKAYKHRYLYEKHHNCTLTKEQIIIFLDGNKKNFKIENLYCISRKINLLLVRNKWYSDNPIKTMTAIKWCELFYSLKNINQILN